MNIKWMIKQYMARLHIQTLGEVAKMTGMKYATLTDKLNHPEKLRLYEIKAIIKALNITKEDALTLIWEESR